jgi:hypothetical protein
MKNIYLLMLCILPLISCSQSNKRENINQPKYESLEPENIFTTLKFEVEGKPCVAVIKNQYKDYKDKALYPLSLFITINTVEQDKNGHPTANESAAFLDLQSKIIRDLSAGFLYCHVGTTTMTGYQDILLYINDKDQEKATAILNRLKEGDKRFSSYTFERDPEWEAVSSFYQAVPKKD